MKQLINTAKLRKALKRFWIIHFGRHSPFKPYTHKEVIKCKCGKKFTVYYNMYRTCIGGGRCECGAVIHIN